MFEFHTHTRTLNLYEISLIAHLNKYLSMTFQMKSINGRQAIPKSDLFYAAVVR